MSVDYAWLTWILCVICTVCEQPALVCHGPQWVAIRALPWLFFVPWASFTSTLCSGSFPSPTRQQAGPIAYTKLLVDVQSSWNSYMRSFKIYGIWSQTDRQTDICTTSANAVTLVWGSLRLAPIYESLFQWWFAHFPTPVHKLWWVSTSHLVHLQLTGVICLRHWVSYTKCTLSIVSLFQVHIHCLVSFRSSVWKDCPHCGQCQRTYWCGAVSPLQWGPGGSAGRGETQQLKWKPCQRTLMSLGHHG